VRWKGIALASILASSPAAADQADKGLYERLWPQAPDRHGITLGQQIQDQITELGNTLGYHAAVLSHDMLQLKFDARKRRAHMQIGGGDEQYLSFKLASDFHFTEGLARVQTKVDLTFRGRTLQLELPEMEMVPASYRGERGVEIRLPLLRRRW
jgi:hypothetical protein